MSSSDAPPPPLPPPHSADPAAQAPAAPATDAAAAVAAAPAAPAAPAAAGETAVSPSTTTAVAEMPPPTPMKSRRKSSRKRKPKAFTPGVNLTAGLTGEMRNTKTTEEFENDLEATTVNRMVENVRSVIPSLSDLSLAFTTATKSVSELSTAASGVAQKATKSVSDLSVAASGAAQKASKSVSDLSVAASGAAQKASEHAFSFTAAMSDMSQKMADGAAAAKQRTSDAYMAASATASAMSEKVSAASKSISDTTTAIMEGATAAKAAITEVSKAATEKAAAVTATVQENVKKAQEVSKVVVDTAAPVVSAVSSGVAAAANTVSDVAANLSTTTSSGGATSANAVSETHIGVLPGGPASSSSAEVIKEYMAATSSAATQAMNKFSGLSRSLTSLFSQGTQGKWSGGGGAATPPPFKSREKDDSEFVALADLSPMPAIAYKGNRSPPNSEGSGGGSARSDVASTKLVSNGENISVYDCDIEKTYQQSTGTNSFESVLPLNDKEINCGPMVKHPVIGQARQAKAVQLVGTELPSKRVEEWALRHIERAEEVPAHAVPQTRMGDRETWMLNQLATRIQNKFNSMKRTDFTLTITRGFDPNGLPFLEAEITPTPI